MKTEFKAKFLQHVAKKRKEEGFTLIELLVVIIIIGILSAIALPSFLNQANKAKQSEAKQYIASINKGQQAYYAENGDFITDVKEIGKLGLGIKTATGNYTYDINENKSANGGANAWTLNAAKGLKYYAGLVYLTDADNALTSQTVLCESDDDSALPVSVDPAANPTAPGAETDCDATAGFKKSL
ncbi:MULTISPECIES: type IV pilin-like G/H family protein [unclassified Okeania]|uniref:type IV pilin-like G/H family protein n=1 Tax=unclassified Okeania TaxID=2634635 RepID=UPI0013BB6705|nr:MULTISPECIES: type IV pilin-like G/H family protein [unclassified Okeania]NES77595.1 prepilin-type N-terminal cleavage/methylation domain-containing protein [Okeania sp. SIO1H4]NET14930.1 prepilin-type N-terminal cleavage/methylation domain-containing protein [Okeania sp. SIO1H6]NET21221.1 prepilin-type N-terminal cleavage/methylation domain-containing protein [Okeania sp. SIO1H5]NET96327.1 prepilin-type N-terminal cleavage/methylation domain-containing protein [Okeania sp. SIO1H2]